jgi:hypothetical protein
MRMLFYYYFFHNFRDFREFFGLFFHDRSFGLTQKNSKSSSINNKNIWILELAQKTSKIDRFWMVVKQKIDRERDFHSKT